MGWILALHGVVTNQLDVQAIEITDQARRNIDHALQALAPLLLGYGNGSHHLLVDQDPQMRNVGQQPGRIRVVQVQLGTGDHLVAAHAEHHAADAIHAPQLQRKQRAKVLETRAVHAHTRWRL